MACINRYKLKYTPMPINYRNYPPNWKTEIVPAIRARSGDRCEMCGLQNYTFVNSFTVPTKNKNRTVLRREWNKDFVPHSVFDVKRVQVILTVAHIFHDSENKNIQLVNLRHWCQLCHLRYDLGYKLEKRKGLR